MACKVISSFDQNSELEMTLPAIYVQFAKPSSIDSLESREYNRCGRRILNWDGHLKLHSKSIHTLWFKSTGTKGRNKSSGTCTAGLG